MFPFWYTKRPPRPGRLVKPKLVGEVVIMALKYTVSLPPVGASDVEHRELSVTLGEGPTTVVNLDKTADLYELLVERDVAVALSLVDVDASGNKSQPSPTLAFTSKDTVPPPAPGELGVTKVEQVD